MDLLYNVTGNATGPPPSDICPLNFNTNHTTWSAALYAVPVVVVSLLALPTNVIVMMVVYRTSALHTNQGTYMFSLALSELLTGLLGLLFSARYAAGKSGPANGTELDIGAYMQYLVITCTLINTIAISLDKLHQIAAPYSYEQMMTKRRCKVVVVVIWVTLGVLSFLPTQAVPIDNYFYCFSQKTFTFITVHQSSFSILILIRITLFVILFSILMVGYGIIFCISRSHQRRMSKYSVSMNAGAAGGQRANKDSNNRARFKGSLTIALIVATFLVLWLPYFLLKAVEATKLKLPVGADFCMNWLAMTHTSVNVVIYGGTYKPFKKGLRSFFGIRKSTNYFPTECDTATQPMNNTGNTNC